MSALDWHTTLTNLDAALATLGSTTPLRTIGDGIRLRLNTTGTVYDAIWTTEIDAAKVAGDALYSSDLTAQDTATQAAFAQSNAVARSIEDAQHTAQASTIQPYVGVAGGEKYPLAPATDVPYDASESAGVSAARNLLHGATPVLRVVAKDAGVPGNTVDVQIAHSNAGLGQIFFSPNGVPGTFTQAVAKGYIDATYIPGSGSDAELQSVSFRADNVTTLSVRRGAGYVETYVLTLGEKIDVSASLLLASAEWFPGAANLPDDLAWSALSGGAGGGIAAMRTRLGRAAKLSACSVEQAGVIALLSTELVAQAASFPSYRVDSTTYPYAKRPAATRIVPKTGAPYLVARVVTDPIEGTNLVRLSPREVEAELGGLVVEANKFRDLTL